MKSSGGKSEADLQWVQRGGDMELWKPKVQELLNIYVTSKRFFCSDCE